MAKNLEFSELLRVYGDMLTEKQRDVLELYYNEDLSLAEIAENEGVSRQGVHDSIKRGEEILNEYESKLGLYRKQKAYEKCAGEILAQAKELRRALASPCFSGIVRQKADALVSGIENNMNIFD